MRSSMEQRKGNSINEGHDTTNPHQRWNSNGATRSLLRADPRNRKVKETRRDAPTEEVKLEAIWPQVKNALNWLMKNHIEGAAKFVKMILCKRRREIEQEEMQRKVEKGAKDFEKSATKFEVIENPNPKGD